MSKPSFDITTNMLNFIVAITQKITRLEIEQERNLHLRKDNRIRSIHSSLAIEKNSLSLNQVSNIINGKQVFGPPQEIREVQNAYDAYNRVFQLNPYLIDDFLMAHSLMMDELVKEKGMFRTNDVGIYDENGYIIHIGARPPFIYDLIKDLFFWASKSDVPDLIKSCVIHFEIEMIHPFQDGNGRMGRLWQNLVLAKWQNIFEWIPVETMIYKNQQEYYDMLSLGGKENNSTQFIEYMLKVILDTIISFEDQVIKNKISDILNDKILDKMSENDKKFFSQIYPYLKEHKEISNAKAVELCDLSPATIRRYFVKLIDLGILVSKGENKSRKYLLNKELI